MYSRHITVPSSILRCASEEATRQPHDHRVVFKATADTTCVYPKGLDRPLVEQETIVFNGASKLRPPTRRDIMADYEMCRISQTYGKRHVDFDLPVLAEAGLVVHLEPTLGVEDMEVEPIREEDSTVDATRRPVDKRRRSIDDATETDVALALYEPKSKKFCLRANTTSEVISHGIKRKWIGSAIAENDAALERKSKRARICAAGASHVQHEVVEVSRFFDCSLFLISLLCLFSSFQSDISYCLIHFFYHHVLQTLTTTETEPVAEDISFEVADDTIVEDAIIAEEAPTELVREEVEATPQAALRREVAALQSSLGPYWVPRRSSRVRKRPDRYVPSF